MKKKGELLANFLQRIIPKICIDDGPEVISSMISKTIYELKSEYDIDTIIMSRNSKVCSNLIELLVKGSRTTKDIAQAVLLSVLTKEEYSTFLRDYNYPFLRRQQRNENIARINTKQQQLAAIRNVPAPKRIGPIKDNRFEKGRFVSDEVVHKVKGLWKQISSGGDPPTPFATTRVSKAKMDIAVAFVYGTCHFRPGKTRCGKCRDAYLKYLPFYICYSSQEVFYEQYLQFLKKFSVPLPTIAVGEKSFRTIVSTLTRQGTYNQGLSCYYIDSLDCIETLHDCLDRILDICHTAWDSIVNNNSNNDNNSH